MLALMLSLSLAQAPTPVVVELFSSRDCSRCAPVLASLEVPGIELISLVHPAGDALRSGLIVDGRSQVSSEQLRAEVITSAERGQRPALNLGVKREGLRITAQVEGVRARRTELFLVEAGIVRQHMVGSPCDGEGEFCPLASSTTRRVAHFQLDPRWNVNQLTVVAVAREGDAGPIISGAVKSL